jgi:tRNA 2-thiocytidine biosynthesis protein TtcA
LCGSQPNLQRHAVKQMLADWEREHPGRIESILSALRHVEPQTLADTRLVDFAALRGQSVPQPDDVAIDVSS